MTVNSMTTVWCDYGRSPEGFSTPDTCHAWVTGDNAADARSNARQQGWGTGLPGGEDYCAVHRGQQTEGEGE